MFFSPLFFIRSFVIVRYHFHRSFNPYHFNMYSVQIKRDSDHRL